MRLGYGISRMVRGTLAGNIYVSARRWKKVSTVSAPVLWCTPGGPHFPPGPFLSSTGRGRGNVGLARKRM